MKLDSSKKNANTTSNTNNPAPTNAASPRTKPVNLLFSNIATREKAKSSAPRISKFTPRTPRGGSAINQEPVNTITPVPRVEEVTPIQSNVDLSEVNFFREEAENFTVHSENQTAPLDENQESSGDASKTDSSEKLNMQAPPPYEFTKEELLSRIANKKPPPPLPITGKAPLKFKSIKTPNTL